MSFKETAVFCQLILDLIDIQFEFDIRVMWVVEFLTLGIKSAVFCELPGDLIS